MMTIEVNILFFFVILFLCISNWYLWDSIEELRKLVKKHELDLYSKFGSNAINIAKIGAGIKHDE